MCMHVGCLCCVVMWSMWSYMLARVSWLSIVRWLIRVSPELFIFAGVVRTYVICL